MLELNNALFFQKMTDNTMLQSKISKLIDREIIFSLNARLISNKLVGNDAAGHKDRVTNTNALQFELLAKREPFEI